MCVKGNIKLLLQRFYFNLKSLKLLFFVPALTINVFIPMLNYLHYRANGAGTIKADIVEKTLLFLPFLSIWWVVFILREYIEAGGSEVLFVCQSKNKLPDALCPFLFYLLNISLLYAVYNALFSGFRLEYFRILCICCFYFGLTYFLVFLTKSITITLLALLIYTLCSIMIPVFNPTFPLYNVQGDLSSTWFPKLYLPLLATGFIFTFLGSVLNKKTFHKD